MKSPAVLRLVESLDAFVDHEVAFQEYLHEQGAETIATMAGMRLRAWHRVHPKVCHRIVEFILILIVVVVVVVVGGGGGVVVEIWCTPQCAQAEIARSIENGILRPL
jgi:hypothetical protein